MSRSFVSQTNRSFALPVADDDRAMDSAASPEVSPGAPAPSSARRRAVGFAAMDTDESAAEPARVGFKASNDVTTQGGSDSRDKSSASGAGAAVSSVSGDVEMEDAAAAKATSTESAPAASKQHENLALKTPPRVSRRHVTTVLPSPLGRLADTAMSSEEQAETPAKPAEPSVLTPSKETTTAAAAATSPAAATGAAATVAASSAATPATSAEQRRQSGSSHAAADDDTTEAGAAASARKQQAQTRVVTLSAVVAATTPVARAVDPSAPPSSLMASARTPVGSALRRQQKPTSVVTLMSQDPHDRGQVGALFDASTPIRSAARARLPPPTVGSASRRQQRPTKIVTLTPATAHSPARVAATPPQRVVLTPKSASPRTPAAGRSSGMPRQAPQQPSSLARGESASAWQATGPPASATPKQISTAQRSAAPMSAGPSLGPISPISFDAPAADDDDDGFDVDAPPPPSRSRQRNRAAAAAAVRSVAAVERDETADQVVGQLTPARATRGAAKPKAVRKQPVRASLCSQKLVCPLISHLVCLIFTERESLSLRV